MQLYREQSKTVLQFLVELQGVESHASASKLHIVALGTFLYTESKYLSILPLPVIKTVLAVVVGENIFKTCPDPNTCLYADLQSSTLTLICLFYCL